MVETTYWFGGWDAILRIIVITTCGYVAMIVLLRYAGWRRLTRMRLFDFIVAVTIGSAFGRMLTAREVGVVDAIVVFATLILLQQLGAWVQRSSRRLSPLMSPPPVLVYFRGQVMEDALRRHRLQHAELLQAVREEGIGSLTDVHAIVLEPSGEFSVIAASKMGDGSAVQPVRDGETPQA